MWWGCDFFLVLFKFVVNRFSWLFGSFLYSFYNWILVLKFVIGFLLVCLCLICLWIDWFLSLVVSYVWLIYLVKCTQKLSNLTTIWFSVTAIGRGLKLFDVKIDSKIKLNWWWKKKKLFNLQWIYDTLFLSKSQLSTIFLETSQLYFD
jgi:hypothetical protein